MGNEDDYYEIPEEPEKTPRHQTQEDKDFVEKIKTLSFTPDWKPYMAQNMGHEPVPIESRSQWKEELKKRGLKCVDSGKEFVSKKEALRRRAKRHIRFSS